jgi:hypothetical protein
MAIFLLLTRRVLPPSWPWLFLQAASAGTIYASIFLGFAISHTERKWYLAKARELLNLRSQLESATGVSVRL